MEDAVLDSDALVDAFELGIEKFSGLRTTHISLYEFLRGLAFIGKDVGAHKAYLEASLEVLPFDNRSVLKASDVYAKLRRKGALVEDPDLVIASICMANGLPIVTGNLKHFKRFEEHGLSLRPKDEFMMAVREG